MARFLAVFLQSVRSLEVRIHFLVVVYRKREVALLLCSPYWRVVLRKSLWKVAHLRSAREAVEAGSFRPIWDQFLSSALHIINSVSNHHQFTFSHLPKTEYTLGLTKYNFVFGYVFWKLLWKFLISIYYFTALEFLIIVHFCQLSTLWYQIKRSHSIYIAIIQIDTTSLQQIQIVFLCKLYHSEFSNMHVY